MAVFQLQKDNRNIFPLMAFPIIFNKKNIYAVNPHSVFASMEEKMINYLVGLHSPSPGGTMPAGHPSSCRSPRMSTKWQTL